MELNATILGQAIAFFLFCLFCTKYVWPPIMNVIETRQKTIASGLHAAKEAKQLFAAAQAQAEGELAAARISAQKIISNANLRKVQIIEQAKNDGENEYKKIIAASQHELASEVEKAREELRANFAHVAALCAQKILMRQIDTSVNSDIVDEFLTKL